MSKNVNLTKEQLQHYYDNVKKREKRYQTKVKLLLQKCKEAGITVSDEEIDRELMRKK